MIKRSKILILISIYFLAIPLFSKDAVPDSFELSPKDPIIWLTGLWNFYAIDDPDISKDEYEGSNPYILNVENEWRLQGVDYEGIGWYRNHFTLSNYEFPLDLGLIVPPISGASEVYVNGEKIGSAGSVNKNGDIVHYSTPFRFYKIPKEILNLDRPNSISIRIFGYQGIAGLYGNNFLFLGEFEKSWNRYILLILVVTIFSSAFVVIGLYHFILYFGQHKNREFLYFGLLGMVTGFHLICMNGLGYYLVDHFYFNQVGIHLAVGFIPLCYVGFVSHFFERNHPILERIGWGFASVVFFHLILLPLVPEIFRFYLDYAFLLGILFIFLSIGFFIIQTFKAYRNKIQSARIIAVSLVIYGISIMNDTLMYLGSPLQYRLGFIGIIFPVVAISIALSRKMKKTQQEKVEAQKQAIINLKKSDELKDEFLANTSHELRTPLHGIIGIAESLTKGSTGMLREDTQENLELIIQSGRRLASLVDDILDFSKMKNNDLFINLQNISIFPIVHHIVKILHPLAEAKGIHLEANLDETQPIVYADSNRLQQVLMNLVGNAIKFTEKGSVKIQTIAKNDFLIISVIDTGIGIPDDKLESIFDAFTQVDSRDTREYLGTGLGLTVTKKLVNLHGSNLKVESKLKEGSRFYFELKLGNSEQMDGDSENYSISPENKTTTTSIITTKDPKDYIPEIIKIEKKSGIILAVDDEPINLKILNNVLTLNGYKTITVDSGEKALDLIMNSPKVDFPDAVLLDIMMPRMSGYEVCRLIREKYESHDLPVIMLTAKRTEADILAGFQSGANDYVTKPFFQDELVSRIETLVKLKAAVENDKYILSIEKELELAKKIQSTLLPEVIADNEDYSISWRYKPMLQVGGDLIDIQVAQNGDIYVLVADVCGHGIGAAFVSSMVKLSYQIARSSVSEPKSILETIHSNIKNLLPKGQFITAGCYRYSPTTNILTLARAGHPALFRMQKGNEAFDTFLPKGRPLGMLPISESYQSVDIPIEKDDIVFLTTDGILETTNTRNEFFEDKKLVFFFRENNHLELDTVADNLMEEIEKFADPNTNDPDDIAFVIFKRNR